MSVLSNCRFLLISSNSEMAESFRSPMDKRVILHFEKCLMINMAQKAINNEQKNGHIFQFIIIDENIGSEQEIQSLFNSYNNMDQYNKTTTLLLKSSNEQSLKSSIELLDNTSLRTYSPPFDYSLLLNDMEKIYNENFDKNQEFIDSIAVGDCIIYKLAPVIDRTISREIEQIIDKELIIQDNTLIFNFKHTSDFPVTEMKYISQILIKSQKKYPFIHTTSFTDEVVYKMRKAGFTQVFDTKTSFKQLVQKYNINTNELKKKINN